MRIVWLVFVVLLLAIGGLWLWQRPAPNAPLARQAEPAPVKVVVARAPVADVETPPQPAAEPAAEPTTQPAFKPLKKPVRADSVVKFALRQLGTAYCYAGTTPASGFDCSGFVRYVFGQYGVDVPHSTALLISVGREVPRTEARAGDIVVFTGTAKTSTTPGHAGIVLSNPGEPLRFVHSSSARRESGVKISTVENTDYERRFMAVRRVL